MVRPVGEAPHDDLKYVTFHFLVLNFYLINLNITLSLPGGLSILDQGRKLFRNTRGNLYVLVYRPAHDVFLVEKE